MIKKFIVSKYTVDLEVIVDGVVEVRPLPHKSFSKETVDVLAVKHQAFIKFNWIKNKEKNLLELAVDYFKEHGFEIKLPL
jgi:hypothetical protein